MCVSILSTDTKGKSFKSQQTEKCTILAWRSILNLERERGKNQIKWERSWIVEVTMRTTDIYCSDVSQERTRNRRTTTTTTKEENYNPKQKFCTFLQFWASSLVGDCNLNKENWLPNLEFGMLPLMQIIPLLFCSKKISIKISFQYILGM